MSGLNPPRVCVCIGFVGHKQFRVQCSKYPLISQGTRVNKCMATKILKATQDWVFIKASVWTYSKACSLGLRLDFFHVLGPIKNAVKLLVNLEKDF